MTKAFIVNLDTGSDTDFATIAEEINDTLTKDGMIVVSVAPWQTQATEVAASPLAPPPPPPITLG